MISGEAGLLVVVGVAELLRGGKEENSGLLITPAISHCSINYYLSTKYVMQLGYQVREILLVLDLKYLLLVWVFTPLGL